LTAASLLIALAFASWPSKASGGCDDIPTSLAEIATRYPLVIAAMSFNFGAFSSMEAVEWTLRVRRGRLLPPFLPEDAKDHPPQYHLSEALGNLEKRWDALAAAFIVNPELFKCKVGPFAKKFGSSSEKEKQDRATFLLAARDKEQAAWAKLEEIEAGILSSSN